MTGKPGGFGWGVRQGLPLTLLAGVLLPLVACGSFFQCENKPACPATTGTGSGSSSTVDYAYVAYTTVSGSTTTSNVFGYNVAGGTLSPVANVTLGFIPVALAVSPNNNFLYVASTPGSTSPGVYAFSITSTGNLTALNSGNPYFTDTVAAMAISPDGGYLYTVSVLGTMAEYPLNASTGVLTAPAALTLPLSNCSLGVSLPVSQTCSVAVSPAKNYVVASLGREGDAVFGYASTTGITGNGAFSQIPAGTDSGDFSIAIDGNNNAYIAQTAGVSVYALTNSNASRGTVSYASGVVPRGITTDPDSRFVFTANEGNGTISAFTIGSTPALNAVTGSPFAGPASVSALGVDSSDSYLVAAGYDTSAGLQLWSIATSGVISQLKSAGTTSATQYPMLVAMSH